MTKKLANDREKDSYGICPKGKCAFLKSTERAKIILIPLFIPLSPTIVFWLCSVKGVRE
jgi:hypothetical protein